jgi:hypothetical protein
MNNETRTKVIFMSLLVAIGAMLSLQACDLRSFVKVDAPKEVLAAINEEQMTLAEAEDNWNDWVYYVESNTKKFEEKIADAEERYATIHSLVSVGLETAGTASQGIPYGGLLFGALTGVAGLMLPQPKFSRKKE